MLLKRGELVITHIASSSAVHGWMKGRLLLGSALSHIYVVRAEGQRSGRTRAPSEWLHLTRARGESLFHLVPFTYLLWNPHVFIEVLTAGMSQAQWNIFVLF